jgi:ribosomal protein S18 acetylase RimI-like enzyme
MLDSRSIMLALDGDTLVGYIHTTLAPSEDGQTFDPATGQICFLCVDPQYHDAPGAAAALVRAGENYLATLGVQKIFGGSPSPSAPFYTGFYGGGEAIGFFLSDEIIINAFLEAQYKVHKKTALFCLDLRNYSPTITAEMVAYHTQFEVEINEIPETKIWWEGCAFANGIWFDAKAFPVRTQRPVARLRTRISYPDTENILTMYGGTWLASLMELRVHPDFTDGKIAAFLLGELARYLEAQSQVGQIESHATEGSLLFALLHNQSWQEQDKGYIFVKDIASAT